MEILILWIRDIIKIYYYLPPVDRQENKTGKMDFRGHVEDYLHLAKFPYNYGYQNTTKMSLFEVLYGWKYRTPVTWDSPLDELMLGPDILKELEQLVTKVQLNLKEAQDRQKSYTDKKKER